MTSGFIFLRMLSATEVDTVLTPSCLGVEVIKILDPLDISSTSRSASLTTLALRSISPFSRWCRFPR